MNNKELQATRKLLMLEVNEAAEEIGAVSASTWLSWEAGEQAVPDAVADEMHTLLTLRLEFIEAIDESLASGEPLSLPFYTRFEEYAADNHEAQRVGWRLSQSVAALYYTEGQAELF